MDEQIINDKADLLIDFLKSKVRQETPGISEAKMWDVIIGFLHRIQEAVDCPDSGQTLQMIKRIQVMKNS